MKTKTKSQEKLIKDCVVCGELFEDKTRPKNKKTCSRKCADEARKARQRVEYRIENPRKPNQREIYYLDHLEYPFWADERIARNQFWKEAVPYSPEKIEQISGAREKYDYHGGRVTNGASDSHKVSVQFVESDREPSEVTSYQMTPEKLADYLANKRK